MSCWQDFPPHRGSHGDRGVPSGKIEPEAGVLVVGRAPLTASMAEVEKFTTAPAALVASTVMFAGTVIAGAVVSLTVTVKVLLAGLPAASLAVTVTVVVPSGKVEPEAGVLIVGRGAAHRIHGGSREIHHRARGAGRFDGHVRRHRDHRGGRIAHSDGERLAGDCPPHRWRSR